MGPFRPRTIAGRQGTHPCRAGHGQPIAGSRRCQTLGLAADPTIDDLDPVLSYRRLAAWFECDGRGLRLQGFLPSGSRGAILVGRDDRPILSESPSASRWLPLSGLVEALLPGSEAMVPSARESDNILRRLPASETPSLAGRGTFVDNMLPNRL